MEDNQVWYYDGLINGGQMVNTRQLDADPAMLSTCRGGSAVLALYVKDLSPQMPNVGTRTCHAKRWPSKTSRLYITRQIVYNTTTVTSVEH